MSAAQPQLRVDGQLVSREPREGLIELKHDALKVESIAEDEIALAYPGRRVGLRNLVDYLALRQHDIRELQQGLFRAGLSSLGVVQGHVMASLNVVIRLLDRLCDTDSGGSDTPNHPSISGARAQLERFADDTPGAAAKPGIVRIMVTMPSQAAGAGISVQPRRSWERNAGLPSTWRVPSSALVPRDRDSKCFVSSRQEISLDASSHPLRYALVLPQDSMAKRSQSYPLKQPSIRRRGPDKPEFNLLISLQQLLLKTHTVDLCSAKKMTTKDPSEFVNPEKSGFASEAAISNSVWQPTQTGDRNIQPVNLNVVLSGITVAGHSFRARPHLHSLT